MKGIIFNLLQEVVEDRFGADVWDEVVERAGVEGAYTSLGTYDDHELFDLVQALAEHRAIPLSDAYVLGGRYGFPFLASRHVQLVTGMATWRAALESLDRVIHPEMERIYRHAAVPVVVAACGTDTVVLEYRSTRRLCSLAEGLVLGLGDWYGSDLVVTHRECVDRGDDRCLMGVTEA